MARKKKKEIIHKKSCCYCMHFFNSKDRTGSTRFCRPKDDYVSLEEEACDNFMPRDSFWCERCGYWMNMRACSIRNAKQLPGCERCTQQKVVQLILDEQEEIEPVVVKRKIRKIKRLKRRR